MYLSLTVDGVFVRREREGSAQQPRSKVSFEGAFSCMDAAPICFVVVRSSAQCPHFCHKLFIRRKLVNQSSYSCARSTTLHGQPPDALSRTNKACYKSCILRDNDKVVCKTYSARRRSLSGDVRMSTGESRTASLHCLYARQLQGRAEIERRL